jgi:glycine cleavage system H protein
MQVPEDLKYASTHEWIRPESDTGTVGITDHAQHELTDIVYVELPKVGARVDKGSAIAVVESVKAASDIYSPASGEVIEVNAALQDDPALVNTDPYGAGWLFRIRLSDSSELDTLSAPAEYREQTS